MQSTSPIRRYVLLRRGQDRTASRWSMERIAPAPRAGTDVLPPEQRTKPASARA